MRRSPRFLARPLLVVVSPLLFVLVAACGSSPRCETTCGTGGAGAGDAGTDDAGAGGHPSPTFPCKQTTCMRGAQVCDVTTHFMQHAMGACGSLPAACKAPAADCTCFGDLMGCMCLQQPTGEFGLFCDVSM